MKNRIAALMMMAALAATTALSQTEQQLMLSPVEKLLAAKASNVDEITLGKNMLGFAAKFMDGKDKDDASVQSLIKGLDGIYVRDYEFDKEGQFTAEQVEQLRTYYETGEWSPIVRERERKTGESTDVMVKLVNGKSNGLLILDVEPREISIVLILGPFQMEDLGKLKGLSGLGSLGAISNLPQTAGGYGGSKNKEKKGSDQ